MDTLSKGMNISIEVKNTNIKTPLGGQALGNHLRGLLIKKKATL